MSEQADVRPILGAGLNHVQALRDAVCWSVGGRALLKSSPDSVANWLSEQGLHVPADVPQPEQAVSVIITTVENYRREALGPLAAPASALSSSLLNPDSKIVGRTRSGAGWSEGAAFCITSAFVRLLGASEQFELDVLKALLHYRPAGRPLGHHADQIDITVELGVLHEEPRIEEEVAYYEKPAIWTWIRGPAEGNDERRKIFKRVFDLELTPGEGDSDRSKNNKRRKEWYAKRNKIAHGREGIMMTLAEYVDVDAFVTKSMVHLAVQCKNKQRLII